MKDTYKLYKATDKKHKFYVIKEGTKKKIYFGAYGYKDYAYYYKYLGSSNAFAKKNAYIARHQYEDWRFLTTPGTWSRYILWSQPTLLESIDYTAKKFKVKIVYNNIIYE